MEGGGNTWNAFHLFPPVAGLVCSSFHLFPPLSTYAPGQFDSSRSCALSKSEIPRKVSGTEPDFVQKLGTEPKFSGDAASLSCLRVNHSFGRMYLARRRTSFNSLARSRNNEGLEGSERRAFIEASKSQNPRYVFAPGPKYAQKFVSEPN